VYFTKRPAKAYFFVHLLWVSKNRYFSAVYNAIVKQFFEMNK